MKYIVSLQLTDTNMAANRAHVTLKTAVVWMESRFWFSSVSSSATLKFRDDVTNDSFVFISTYFHSLMFLFWLYWLPNIICVIYDTTQTGWRNYSSLFIHCQTKFFRNKIPWEKAEEAWLRPLKCLFAADRLRFDAADAFQSAPKQYSSREVSYDEHFQSPAVSLPVLKQTKQTQLESMFVLLAIASSATGYILQFIWKPVFAYRASLKKKPKACLQATAERSRLTCRSSAAYSSRHSDYKTLPAPARFSSHRAELAGVLRPRCSLLYKPEGVRVMKQEGGTKPRACVHLNGNKTNLSALVCCWRKGCVTYRHIQII